jgi:hypothetical protein
MRCGSQSEAYSDQSLLTEEIAGVGGVQRMWQKRYTVFMSRSFLKRFRRGHHDRGRFSR